MSTKVRFGFVTEYVTDIEASTRFYVDVLGLEIEREHPTFVQFKDEAGANFAIASTEPLGGGEPEISWIVDDVEAAYNDLSQKAEVSLSLTQLPFGKIFGVLDPAGQPHYLLEFAQNRPSRPVP